MADRPADPVLSYHYTIHQPGTYVYTFQASGSYALTGGVIVYSGMFTSHEQGTSDSVTDYDETWDGLWLTTTWDWHNQSHWGFTRDESGSFGASGVTSTYTLTEWGNGSYTSDESGDYLDTSTTTYSSVSNEWSYLLSSARLWNWTYIEHGSVTPNGTTGDYSYDESASDTYDYFEEGSYSYGYLDAYTSQSSTYDYTWSVDETSASSYSEDATFDAAGTTGTFTYHEEWEYGEDFVGNGTDSYSFAWGGRTSGWSYGYTETSTWDGSDVYDEWGSFTPTVTTADWSWDEEAIETYSYNGSGTEGWTCTDANTTQTYTATFTDSEGWTYGYTYGEDGHYVDTYDTAGLLVSSTESGSYSFDESEIGTWTYGNSANYTFSVDDGLWLGSYTGNSSYTESGNWDYTFSDAGTFLDDDETGAYLWTDNESWTWTSGGTGSAYYTYTADYTTGWHSYSGTQSGSGGGQYHYFESTAYTPDSTLGLYSSSESSNSIYHYAETGSNHFSYANAGTSTDWGGGWSISDDYTYDYGYDEAGLVTEDGPIGAYTLSEGDLELYRWSAWGDYDYDYADATTTASNDWAWSESFGYDWGSDYFEWGVFGPGGEVGLYDYSEEYAESWDYNGSGDWFSDYATTNVTSHSSGHWSYVGWDDYGFVVSDVGSFSEDGEVGFYSLQEAWAGSYTYDANGSASRTETYPGGTYTYPGGYTYVVPGTTTSGSSSYTYHGNWTYSGSAEYDKAYDEPGETYVSFYSYDHVADGTITGHSEGSSSYSGPGGSSSTSYVGDSTGSTHDEWHTTTLSAWSVTVGAGGWPIWTMLGSVSDHSEVHTTSSSTTWSGTSTLNGVTSTTGGTYSSSTSTPSSSHTESGTPPSGPPTAPTYSGPGDADFDTLLTALATAAADAYTSPTTRAAATDAAIASFTALDAASGGGGALFASLVGVTTGTSTWSLGSHIQEIVKLVKELPQKLRGLSGAEKALILDVFQLALDVGGFFEPTPFCDGANAIIAALRGNWLDAGLSLVGVFPYVGDLGKLAKIPRYVNSTLEAIELAKKSERFASIVRPALKQLQELLPRVPLEKLPDSAQHGLRRLKDKLDEFLGIASPTNRGALREAMLRQGKPPGSMANPQAHHDLPWTFKDWFAKPERGLDVNDPRFGRWVEDTPPGRHQNWSRAYEEEWRAFIRDFPRATRQQVLEFLNRLRTDPRFR